MLYKSDKEKMFAYNTSVICDNNNYILTVDTNPSNMYDSVSFYQSFENLSNHFDISNIKYFVGDAAYITPHICKTIIDLENYSFLRGIRVLACNMPTHFISVERKCVYERE